MSYKVIKLEKIIKIQCTLEEYKNGGFTELVECKSLISAKRWVATQLMKR